jgi:hypothetical protein
MTDNDAAIELENPPDVIRHYPRFRDACAQGAAALRRDGHRRGGDLAGMYKAHLDRVLDAAEASSVDEVVEKLDGGGK